MLHNAPPLMINIKTVDDARLYYRISVKGPPALTLPRKENRKAEKELAYTTPLEIVNVQ